MEAGPLLRWTSREPSEESDDWVLCFNLREVEPMSTLSAAVIQPSLFWVVASLVFPAAVYAQDPLTDYGEDLSVYGQPRPGPLPNIAEERQDPVAMGTSGSELSRDELRELFRAPAVAASDGLGDYMEDFRDRDRTLADTQRAASALTNASVAPHSAIGDGMQVTVIIEPYADTRGPVTRFVTRLGKDDAHIISFGPGNGLASTETVEIRRHTNKAGL